MKEKVIVLDFGGPFGQIVARRVRASCVYCEVWPYTRKIEQDGTIKGIVLSGGATSINAVDAPLCAPDVLNMGIPVLGIAYGMHVLTKLLGGRIEAIEGATEQTLTIKKATPLFEDVEAEISVFMNHVDGVAQPPEGFASTASALACPVAAMENKSRGLYGFQFHPEAPQTHQGTAMLENFLFKVCGCTGDYRPENQIDLMLQAIRETVGDGKMVSGLSGGVDSSVCSVLANRALGDRLTCVFVDHGVLRKHEVEQVLAVYRDLGLSVVHVDASERFLRRLKGVVDPETKRKIIGEEFIRVFEEEAQKIGADFLLQGTIYPDRIESGQGSALVKSHHNVGGLPEDSMFPTERIVEPLADFFKDEVRVLGKALGIPHDMLWRHPFPGPGLAVRILGEVTRERADLLRECDAIFMEELRAAGLYDAVWQGFAILTGLRTVGVMGDKRTYGECVALRAVLSTDAMAVEVAQLPYELLDTVMRRITHEVEGVNRVVYDITSKPPGTIEWE